MTDHQLKMTKPRGRPSRSSEEVARSRHRIASHASRLFKEEGYKAVSIRKLAEAAGCTPRTVYAHFTSKFEILTMIWVEIFEDLFAQLGEVARHENDPFTRLERVCSKYVTYWLDNSESYFLVFMSGGISRTDVESFVSGQSPEGHFKLFQDCIASALGERAASDRLDRASEALICGLNGIAQAHSTLHGHPWSEPEELVTVMVKCALHA